MISYTSSENTEDAQIKVINDLALKEVLKLRERVNKLEERIIRLEGDRDD